MYITPISAMLPPQDAAKTAAVPQGDGKLFGNLLNDLIKNAEAADQVVQEDIVKLTTGTTDDLHSLPIHTEQAELATLLLVQVRNKVLDAYNEIMRVTL